MAEPSHHPAITSRPRQVLAYGFALAGPVVGAGAQLLLSLQVLHSVSPGQFGTFSFLLIAFQLCLGVSNALFCAPYPLLLRDRTVPEALRVVLAANLAVSLVLACGIALLAFALAGDVRVAAAFGGFTLLMLWRWFGRAQAYAQAEQRRVVTSDVVYGTCLLAALLVNTLLGGATLVAAAVSLLASAVLALAALGPRLLSQQATSFAWRGLGDYRSTWRQHSRWSLLGVATTEGTANAHAYLVTLVGGAAAFAPLAATALLVRPISLAMNALTEFERPRLARLLHAGGSNTELRSSLRIFRLALLATWAGSLLLALGLLTLAPYLLFPESYPLETLWTGVLLWLLVALIQVVRTPESVGLQAAGEFRILAFASVASCGASIVGVSLLVAGGHPLWSLAGVAFGEGLFALAIWARSRRYTTLAPQS